MRKPTGNAKKKAAPKNGRAWFERNVAEGTVE
jgi:hypothetical protein